MQLEEEEIFIDLCLETPVWAATWEFISGNGKKTLKFPQYLMIFYLKKYIFQDSSRAPLTSSAPT